MVTKKKKNGIYVALIPNYPTNTNPNDIWLPQLSQLSTKCLYKGQKLMEKIGTCNL